MGLWQRSEPHSLGNPRGIGFAAMFVWVAAVIGEPKNQCDGQNGRTPLESRRRESDL